MTYRQLACAHEGCLSRPHEQSPPRPREGGMIAALYWPWCFDHLVAESLRLSREHAVNRSCSCGWPALYGGLCSRCMAREAETAYQQDKAIRALAEANRAERDCDDGKELDAHTPRTEEP